MKNEIEGSTVVVADRGECLKANWRLEDGRGAREKVQANKSEDTKRDGRIGFADEGAKRKAPLYESIFLFCQVDNTCPAIPEKCIYLLRDGTQLGLAEGLTARIFEQ